MTGRLLLLARGVTAAGVLLAAAFGCGLLEDATAFTVASDWYKVTIDTASLGVSVPAGNVIPAVPCNMGCDKTAITCGGQKYSCKIQCGSNSNCEVVGVVEEAMPVDLTQQINNQAGAKALSKAELSAAYYSTEDGNSLNFATPKIEIFIGPAAATKTTDSGVVRFATLPAIPAGKQLPATKLDDISAEGNNALSSYVLNRAAFKFLVKATLAFPSGSPIPQGRLVFKVQAHIKVTPLS